MDKDSFKKWGYRCVDWVADYLDEAEKYLAQEHFPPGSMGPKIEAAIEYVRSGGKEVLITSANHLKASLINRSGTKIIAAQ